MRTSLYRHFSENGVLLYVGVSLNTVQRLLKHRSTSHWFKDIGRITVEYYDTRAEAFKAERKAIRSERPLFNIAHAIQAAEIEPGLISWNEEEEAAFARFEGMAVEQIRAAIFGDLKNGLLAMFEEVDPGVKVRAKEMSDRALSDAITNCRMIG